MTPDEQVRFLAQGDHLPVFDDALAAGGVTPLDAGELRVLQINVGKLCNQTCLHCHVDAGPHRTEVMTRETMEQCVAALRAHPIPTVDITGGAPELNPSFRWLVERSRELGRHVIDRCNLTVLLLPGQRDLGRFLADHQVEVVASLPYYLADETDRQRGSGVFAKSVEALQLLNELGYGRPGNRLTLSLVFNPVGAYLPPSQSAIEADYRRELKRRHGLEFTRLFTITNMPISRFLDYLVQGDHYGDYMQRLVERMNPAAAGGVMCRDTLSVGWDGRLYDCDFNQMLDLGTRRAPAHIRDFSAERLQGRRIVTGRHCFGCTAGAGSSCGGATA